MLKPFLALALVCSLGAAEPTPSRGSGRAAVPPPPPPPPPMPTALDCWRDFFSNINACQHDFEGTDRIVVAQRRAALSGAATGFNSCLNLVPVGSPVTQTPEVPADARPWTCLEQLVLDIKECRTKYSPGVPTLQGDPERDTMKNAFDLCLNGAMNKNGWCNGRRPNNPVAPLVRIDILNAPVLAAGRDSVTFTVAHSGAGAQPINIHWYAAVFNGKSEVIAHQSLGMSANVPAEPTELTLPLEGVGQDGVGVVVVGRAESAGVQGASGVGGAVAVQTW